jgi:hypothetical protein
VIDGVIDGRIDDGIGRGTDRVIDGRIDGGIDRGTYGVIDGRIDGRQMEGEMKGWRTP